jgi:GrpB-like predicted nucleotidyltransferase (UPF0157 family)
LVPYDVTWVHRYTEIAAALDDVLGSEWVTEHVGSTSVPGLLAKPVVDLAIRLPEATRLTDATGAFLRAGWTEPVELGDHWATFLLARQVRTAIGHIFAPDQWPAAHLRLFADWLRNHEADRDRYADLKAGLVAGGTWGSEYTHAKGAFVLEIVNRAREHRGLRPVSGPL